jgi:hypothetical protein
LERRKKTLACSVPFSGSSGQSDNSWKGEEAMSAETKVEPEVVIELKPGQSHEIPGNSKTTAENMTEKEGKLFFRLTGTRPLNGTILIPPQSGKNVPLGASGGVIKNTGKVPLTIVYFIG